MTTDHTRDLSTFGTWVRTRRLEAGLTQAQLAARADLGVVTVRHIEHAARDTFGDLTYAGLAAGLGVPLAEIRYRAGLTDTPPDPAPPGDLDARIAALPRHTDRELVLELTDQLLTYLESRPPTAGTL